MTLAQLLKQLKAGREQMRARMFWDDDWGVKPDDIVKQLDGYAELRLFDEIGYWGISHEVVVEALDIIGDQPVLVRINCPGGEVYDGFAIYNALKAHKHEVTTRVEGWAASMASLIMLAGDVREIYRNAFVMIHNPWGFIGGDADDHRAYADHLQQLTEQAVAVYAAHTNLTEYELPDLMANETWYNGDTAGAAGFAVMIDTDDIADIPERALKSMKAPSALSRAVASARQARKAADDAARAAAKLQADLSEKQNQKLRFLGLGRRVG